MLKQVTRTLLALVSIVAVVPFASAAPITSGLRLWLDANDATTLSTTVSSVDTWADKSTLGNDAGGSGGTRPTYSLGTGANGTNVLVFDTDDRLNAGTSVLPDDSDVSIFMVFDRAASGTLGTGRGGFFHRQTSSPFPGLSFGQGNSTDWSIGVSDGTDVLFTSTTNVSGLQLQSGTVDFNPNPGTSTLRSYANGGLSSSNSATNIDSVPTSGNPVWIMNRDNTGTSIEGGLSEIIVYDRVLNAAERTITNNYLSSKYNLTLTAGDVYDGDTPGHFDFDHDVFGIGNDQSGVDPGSVTTATRTGGAIVFAGTGLEDGEFILAGFANDNDPTQDTFYLDATNLNGNESLSITYDTSILGLTDNFALGYSADDPNSLVFLTDGSLVGNELTFVLNAGALQDGFFGLVPPVPEPASALLLAAGFALLFGGRRQRKLR